MIAIALKLKINELRSNFKTLSTRMIAIALKLKINQPKTNFETLTIHQPTGKTLPLVPPLHFDAICPRREKNGHEQVPTRLERELGTTDTNLPLHGITSATIAEDHQILEQVTVPSVPFDAIKSHPSIPDLIISVDKEGKSKRLKRYSPKWIYLS